MQPPSFFLSPLVFFFSFSILYFPHQLHPPPTKQADESDEEEEEEEEGDTGDGCPLLTSEGQREFPYRALASVHDIEELAELGKQDGTCSYYGARKAAALAQV